MFNNLTNTHLADASSEELELAMGAPAKTVTDKGETTDNKPVDEEKKDKPTKQTKTTSSKSISQPNIGDLSDVEDDDLGSAFNTSEEDTSNTKEDETDDENPDDTKDEGEEENDEGNDKNTEDDDGTEIAIGDFLKARVDLLVKKGAWVDFEGRDTAEWDEATFEEMEMKQMDYKRELMREEIMDGFGPLGRQIAEYTANGGNPDKIIDMFKEEQRLDNLSTETEEGQRNVVFKYLTEVLGKSPERANKAIQTLIADKELALEAEENKKLMQKAIQSQIDQEQEKQRQKIEAAREDQAKTLQKFSNDVVTYVNSATDMGDDEKAEVINALTKFDKKLKNGTPINQFYEKFADFKKNLPDYITLVRLVLNPKKFTESLITQGNNKAAERAFQLARTANSSKKTKSVSPAPGGPNAGKPKTTFKLMM